MRARVALLVGLVLGSCQLAGPASPDGGGELPPVVVRPGPISRAEEAEAARLLQAARGSFEARRLYEVVRTTSDIVDRFGASDVSGEALFLGARAELALNEPEQADAAAERYLSALRRGDPRATDARLLQADAWQGDAATQLDRLLRIGRTATAAQLATALPISRAAADALSPEELQAVLAAAPTDGPLAPVAQTRYAVGLLDQGDAERANRVAQAALEGGPADEEREMAESVLRGELPEGRGRVRSFQIATALPTGGPPAMSDFAGLIAEGVEVAAATVLGDGYDVTVVPFDDQGDPTVAAGLITEMESQSVAGVVGFLEDETLLSAGLARQDELPIVSPTARTAAEAGQGVYSLEGPDPQAAASVARYAASRAYQRVAIILPNSSPASEEADAFQTTAEGLGVRVVGRYAYESGATYFESQILGAQNALRAEEIAALGLGPNDTLHADRLEPVAIFMPIPREDLEFLAPQIAHFALDTLAIELLGTSGWTDPQELAALDPRYTDGVVATAPEGTGPDSPGILAFRRAYEQHFQRTLVNPTPAIGYDAALLLLEALRPGRVRHPDVVTALEGLTDVEGATGILSIVDDRVVRRTQVVRIRNRALIPVPVD
jgi:ABC-type branched-subunit amino acid transport system substrate-binding protein